MLIANAFQIAGLDLNGGKAIDSSPIIKSSSNSNSGVYVPPQLRGGNNNASQSDLENRDDRASKYDSRDQRGGGSSDYRRGGGGLSRGYNNRDRQSGDFGNFGGRRRYEDNYNGK